MQGHKQELDETKKYQALCHASYEEAYEEAKLHFKKKEEWFYVCHVYATFLFEFQQDIEQAIQVLENATNPYSEEDMLAEQDEQIIHIVSKMLDTLQNYRDIKKTIEDHSNAVKYH